VEGERVVKLRIALAAAMCACAFGSAGQAVAAPGPADLDRSFGGGDGIAEVTGPAGSLPQLSGARMALGPADEIYVLYSDYSTSCDPPFECQVALSVERFTPQGEPDPSFASGPQLVVKGSPYNDYFELAVGSDGKPVIAAYDEASGMVAARLGLDGHLDPSFGVGGVTPFAAPHSIETARDYPKLAVQPDGRVVVAVQGAREDGGRALVVTRYLTDGQPDPGFGSGGEASVTIPNQSRPAGVFIGADGSITVPAPLCCLAGTGLFGEGLSVVRLTAAGQPDPGWASDGSLFVSSPGSESAVEAATAAGDDLFLSVENSTPTVSTVGHVLKLGPSGALDPGFGSQGGVRLFNRVGSVSPSDLAVDAKGRLVGVGWDGRIAVFRLGADGSKDRTFNGGQKTTLPYGGGGTTEHMVGIQSSGRIVAFGDSGLGATKRFGLIALQGGTTRARCFGKRATIVGTRGSDRLTGTPHRDVIAALGGADTVRGLGGNDLICGGRGRDTLYGGRGRDKLYGGGGRDKLGGGKGRDRLRQ
jgi:serralysin